jgi:hypothetical protein
MTRDEVKKLTDEACFNYKLMIKNYADDVLKYLNTIFEKRAKTRNYQAWVKIEDILSEIKIMDLSPASICDIKIVVIKNLKDFFFSVKEEKDGIIVISWE